MYDEYATKHKLTYMSVFCSLPFRVDQELWDLRESQDFKDTQWVSCIQIYALMNAYKITLTFAVLRVNPLIIVFVYVWIKESFAIFLYTSTNQTWLSINYLKMFKYLPIIRPSQSIIIPKKYYFGLDKEISIFIFILCFSLTIGSLW